VRTTPADLYARSAGACIVAVAVFAPAAARGAPQWNSAVTAGVIGVSGSSSLWERTQFYGAARGDVLFLRDGPRAFGVGPTLELATAGFSDVRALSGAEALLPLGDLWAVALRPSVYVRAFAGETDPGASFRGWFGIQTYNYDGAYAPRGGLVVGYDQDLGGSKAHGIVVAAEVDGLILALPVLLLYEWLHGASDE